MSSDDLEKQPTNELQTDGSLEALSLTATLSGETLAEIDTRENPDVETEAEEKAGSTAPSPLPNWRNCCMAAGLWRVFCFFQFLGNRKLVWSFPALLCYCRSAGESNSAISWITSAQGLCIVSGSIAAGRLLDI